MVKVFASAGERVDVIAQSSSTQTPSSALTWRDLTYSRVGMMPFALGQTFKRGDVPAGANVVADCAAFQFIAWNYHDDGSVRDARIAGYCDVRAAGTVRVTMRLGTAPAASTPVTMRAPAVDVTIDSAAISSTGRAVYAGPVCRQDVWTHTLDAQVRVIYTAHTFANGEVEITTPRIENAGFTSTTQPNRVLAVSVRIGSVPTFSETVDVKHHSAPRLMRGSQWSYWIGGDATLTHEIEHDYWLACESFPPYVRGNAKLPALKTTYAPNYVGESGGVMGATGGSPRIGLLARSNLYYLCNGGRIAYDYMMAEALSAGSWSIHFRDEATGDLPRMATYPILSLLSGTLPKGSGPLNHDPVVDTSHQPSSVYVAAKVTGWPELVDEHLHWTLYNHFYQHAQYRQNDKGIIRSDVGANQDRGAAWGLRTLAQAISLVQWTHALLPDLVYAWKSNMAYYRARFVDGTLDGGRYVTPMGIFAPYSSSGTSLYTDGNRGTSTMWWGSAWMQSFITQSLGHAIAMRLPVPAAVQDDARAVFMQSAKLVVGLTGTTWNWRRMGAYAIPFLRDGSKTPQDTTNAWLDFPEAYAEYCRALNLQTLDPNATGASLKKHGSEADADEDDWKTLYVAKQWPALTFAVMHSAPGATAALARVMSSSTWPLIAKAVDEPEWSAMMPPGYKHPAAP